MTGFQHTFLSAQKSLGGLAKNFNFAGVEVSQIVFDYNACHVCQNVE